MPYTTSYKCAKTGNANYLVHITSEQLSLEIVADMPEEFSTAVAGEYESLLPSNLGSNFGAFGNSIESASKIFAGSGGVEQGLSQQIWVNSSPLEISLSLHFDYQSDVLNDVVYPMRTLEMLAMPSSAGGLLYAPNGVRGIVGMLIGSGSKINVSIGRQFTMQDAIFVNVQSTMDNRLSSSGWPIAGKSEITIRSPVVYSRENWAAITGTSAIQSTLNGK